MGLLTTRPGGIVRKEDVSIAKNYLTEDELQVLNRIVNLYRAPLKIHISSLPRRRESSQINKLDSRLPPAFARVTGNDEFLEVPYIEYAELQALERKSMTMRDWITKLDEFLKLSEHELLDHAGKISADTAKAKAELEYARYRALLDSEPRPVDADFERAAKQIQKLPRPKKSKSPKP